MIVETLKTIFDLKMGCGQPSKFRHDHNSHKADNNEVTLRKGKKSKNRDIVSFQKYDEIFVNVLYTDLNENPDWFVLTNVLMSVQFFENFQRDILKVAHTEGIKLDNKLNKILLKDECMECVSPDVIVDKLNKNIRFKPHHGPKKLYSEGLLVKRLYIINDHIDVINSMDNIPQYTSIDKPSYQVRVEESKKKGFVRLKFIDSNKIPKIYEPVETLGSDSVSDGMDSDSDYTTITELRTPKFIDILQGTNRRRDSIPKSYFAQRKIPRNLSDGHEEVYDDPDNDILYEKVTYLDAHAFMSDFEKSIFPNSLGQSLGFDETEISRAKCIPGKIFCNMLDEDDPDSFLNCEIIPGVSISWPGEQAFEFEMREDRPTITDRRTGRQYRWPTDDMIKEIKSLSCVLIPRGFYNKQGTTSSANADLEWEIAFPKAERYIESRMSHTQMRCMLFLMTIHKTYIEPATHQNGVLVEHIRHHIYWECEKDYRDWPEYRIGLKMKHVMLNFMKKLSKAEMPDYFIKSKNVFENIPKKYLHFAQKVFHDIVQSPVMTFVRALRNVRLPSDRFGDDRSVKKRRDFYQTLDWKKLCDVLVKSNVLDFIYPKSKEPVTLMRYADKHTQWEHMNQLKRRQERLKKIAEQKKIEEESKRNSVDSINTEWICEKQFELIKAKAILDIFIENFIKMAEVGLRIAPKDQALLYLKQSFYLTTIMERKSPSFVPEVLEYRDRITELETRIKKQAAVEKDSNPKVAPETPARNSMQFEITSLNAAKAVPQRTNGVNFSLNGAATEKPHSVLKMSVSMKNNSKPLKKNYSKSISFV